MHKLILTALTLSLAAPVVHANPAETVAQARIGYYRLVGLEMETLAAMAKGEIPYDAEVAKQRAENLAALRSYNAKGLYAEGTSNVDLPGKTRAKPEIWQDLAGLQAKGAAFGEAIDGLLVVADQGEAAFKPAFGKLGGTCKACHDDFRATDY
ncbi:c-type cytochrome [Pseudorhodobacter aquimaris]|uniref:c-type cytochrome n=1 Tax=Pseudorhodobacter aquimaris TaxID=687412 RepID=UPI00067D2B29|nr:cytochrome c [Pseudorhodobacter aquimaris]